MNEAEVKCEVRDAQEMRCRWVGTSSTAPIQKARAREGAVPDLRPTFSSLSCGQFFYSSS